MESLVVAQMSSTATQHASVVFAVVGYGACSSIMLVINKLAVHFLPAPSFLLLAQSVSSWVSVKLAGMAGLIDVDELDLGKAKCFFPVAAAFLACIFTNMKTLQHANVETFIVFRASTPLLIGIAEWHFLGRELPNLRSTLAILALIAGSCLYVATDAHYHVRGYMWVGIWYVIFSFDQLYIKHAVDTVKMRSNWGRVFYTNLWASVLLLGMSLATEPAVVCRRRHGVRPRPRPAPAPTPPSTCSGAASMASSRWQQPRRACIASLRPAALPRRSLAAASPQPAWPPLACVGAAGPDGVVFQSRHRPGRLVYGGRGHVVLRLPLPCIRLRDVVHCHWQRVQDPDCPHQHLDLG